MIEVQEHFVQEFFVEDFFELNILDILIEYQLKQDEVFGNDVELISYAITIEIMLQHVYDEFLRHVFLLNIVVIMFEVQGLYVEFLNNVYEHNKHDRLFEF
jgi:hypothetical protein